MTDKLAALLCLCTEVKRLGDMRSAHYKNDMSKENWPLVREWQAAYADLAEAADENVVAALVRCAQELENIGSANSFDRSIFESQDEFSDWAQSRARFIGAALDAALDDEP